MYIYVYIYMAYNFYIVPSSTIRGILQVSSRSWSTTWVVAPLMCRFSRSRSRGGRERAKSPMVVSIVIGVPENGWFIMEHPIKMDDYKWVPPFMETTTWQMTKDPCLRLGHSEYSTYFITQVGRTHIWQISFPPQTGVGQKLGWFLARQSMSGLRIAMCTYVCMWIIPQRQPLGPVARVRPVARGNLLLWLCSAIWGWQMNHVSIHSQVISPQCSTEPDMRSKAQNRKRPQNLWSVSA